MKSINLLKVALYFVIKLILQIKIATLFFKGENFCFKFTLTENEHF